MGRTQQHVDTARDYLHRAGGAIHHDTQALLLAAVVESNLAIVTSIAALRQDLTAKTDDHAKAGR